MKIDIEDIGLKFQLGLGDIAQNKRIMINNKYEY